MKYSKSKIFKAVAVLALVVTVFLSLGRFHNTRCHAVSIKIIDSAEVNFIDKNAVLDTIYSVIPNIEGYKMKGCANALTYAMCRYTSRFRAY